MGQSRGKLSSAESPEHTDKTRSRKNTRSSGSSRHTEDTLATSYQSVSRGTQQGDEMPKRKKLGKDGWWMGFWSDDKKGLEAEYGSRKSGQTKYFATTKTKKPQNLEEDVTRVRRVTVCDQFRDKVKEFEYCTTDYEKPLKHADHFMPYYQPHHRRRYGTIIQKSSNGSSRHDRQSSESSGPSAAYSDHEKPRSVSESILNGEHISKYDTGSHTLPVRTRTHKSARTRPSGAVHSARVPRSPSPVEEDTTVESDVDNDGGSDILPEVHRAHVESDSETEISPAHIGAHDQPRTDNSKTEALGAFTFLPSPHDPLIPTVPPSRVARDDEEHKGNDKKPATGPRSPDKVSRKKYSQREDSDRGTQSYRRTETRHTQQSSHTGKHHRSSRDKDSTRRPSDRGERSRRQTSEKDSGKSRPRPRAQSPDESSRPSARKHPHRSEIHHRQAGHDRTDHTHAKSPVSVLLEAISEDETSDRDTRESPRRAGHAGSRTSRLRSAENERSIDQRTKRHTGLKKYGNSKRKSGWMGWSWT